VRKREKNSDKIMKFLAGKNIIGMSTITKCNVTKLFVQTLKLDAKQ
jgi:hypothetical protein